MHSPSLPSLPSTQLCQRLPTLLFRSSAPLSVWHLSRGRACFPEGCTAPATISLLFMQGLAQAGRFLGRKAQGVLGLRCLGINN